jgi:predicted metal-dependent phosphoesterase TrpH
MFAFDLHLHTQVFSDCSFIEPEDLVQKALSSGLHGIALTEHGMRWPDDRFGKLQDLAGPSGLVLINGQEIFTANRQGRMEGEFLVFGMKKSMTSHYAAQELVERVHGEGGILIAAHPYRLSRGGRQEYYGSGDGVYDLDLDALELYHPDHGEEALEKCRRAMEKLSLPGTGGSDAHKILEVGCRVTLFEREVMDEEDLVREIRQGNIRAESRFEILPRT